MKKSGLPIIILALLAIVLILSAGKVTQGKEPDVAIVEVDKARKEILITPTGKLDVLVLPEIMSVKGLKISSFRVGEEIRDDFPVVYVEQDYNKLMRITFDTLWGEKVYVVKIILKDYIQFVIDGEVAHIASKMDLAALKNFPDGEYTWYTDQALTHEFDLTQLNDRNFLYTRTS